MGSCPGSASRRPRAGSTAGGRSAARVAEPGRRSITAQLTWASPHAVGVAAPAISGSTAYAPRRARPRSHACSAPRGRRTTFCRGATPLHSCAARDAPTAFQPRGDEPPRLSPTTDLDPPPPRAHHFHQSRRVQYGRGFRRRRVNGGVLCERDTPLDHPAKFANVKMAHGAAVAVTADGDPHDGSAASPPRRVGIHAPARVARVDAARAIRSVVARDRARRRGAYAPPGASANHKQAHRWVAIDVER